MITDLAVLEPAGVLFDLIELHDGVSLAEVRASTRAEGRDRRRRRQPGAWRGLTRAVCSPAGAGMSA